MSTHCFVPLTENGNQISGIPRKPLFHCPQHCQSLVFTANSHSSIDSNPKEKVDPFSLVADEISLVSNRLRSSAVSEVPELASAARYFFEHGVEGKRTCSMVVVDGQINGYIDPNHLLVASDTSRVELCRKQQLVAEITEMILLVLRLQSKQYSFQVASLIHDDILDDVKTRRGVSSLNFVVGNKLAVLAGDFLLFSSSKGPCFLENESRILLPVKPCKWLQRRAALQHGVYMQKTYHKTASLVSNSCKAMALLSNQAPEVAMLTFEYGKNLGLAYQLIDDILDFTGTSASLGKGLLSDIRQLNATSNQTSGSFGIDWTLEYLWKSKGIQGRKNWRRSMLILLQQPSILPKSSSSDVRKS
ncbi:solanesyl diphosphate synthase 3, chloroplastic/mitochondrial-like, partial [Hibiscus syriacus]|uniref:solanesyl diphosphate synthase 3, chloroplastic/mitochondrial-like n=1 Tax=Hibiscus syriacus TaxID=106335 RepID=UPI0019249466